MTPLSLNELGEYILKSLPKEISACYIAYEELVLQISVQAVIPVLSFLHDDAKCHFKMLVDVCGCDYPQQPLRFEVVYNLLSTRHNRRIRIKLKTDAETPVDSVASIYPAAGWFEREVWDMYGVYFANNPDLRRILTDYGFDGHPLRKDFPMTGYVEVRYDEVQKRVVYEPVKLTQEFRSFDFLSPWEGPDYPLPGDEKVASNG